MSKITAEFFEIEGPVLIHPKVIEDERGYFMESFSAREFNELGISLDFVQDNQSLSRKNILRGLHFQTPPFEQGKLVRVVKGAVIDVAVDLRKDSKTYGQHVKAHLTETNKCLFWVPPGFAHGFYTLEDETLFSYKCTGYYNQQSELGLAWNDETLNINWELIDQPILSAKDTQNMHFKDFISPF